MGLRAKQKRIRIKKKEKGIYVNFKEDLAKIVSEANSIFKTLTGSTTSQKKEAEIAKKKSLLSANDKIFSFFNSDVERLSFIDFGNNCIVNFLL